MAQASNAAPGARVEHQVDRRVGPVQMATSQTDRGRGATEAIPPGQMAAEDAPPPRRAKATPKVAAAPSAATSAPASAWAAFGTGSGAAIVFRDLASI